MSLLIFDGSDSAHFTFRSASPSEKNCITSSIMLFGVGMQMCHFPFLIDFSN